MPAQGSSSDAFSIEKSVIEADCNIKVSGEEVNDLFLSCLILLFNAVGRYFFSLKGLTTP